MKRADILRRRKEQKQVQDMLALHAVRQGTMSKASCSLKPKKLIYCPDAGRKKMLFPSEEKALRFMEFNNGNIRKASGFAPVRVYFCRLCGGFHLTSADAWEDCDNYGRTDYILESLSQKNVRSKNEVQKEDSITVPTYITIMNAAQKHLDEERFWPAVTSFRNAYSIMEKEVEEWISIDRLSESRRIGILFMVSLQQWAKVVEEKYQNLEVTTTEQQNEINNFCGLFKFVSKICKEFELWDEFKVYDAVYQKFYKGYVECRQAISLYSRIAQLKAKIRSNLSRLQVYCHLNIWSESQLIIRQTKEHIETLYELDPIYEELIPSVEALMKYQQILDENKSDDFQITTKEKI